MASWSRYKPRTATLPEEAGLTVEEIPLMEMDPSQLLEILKFRTSAPCGIMERNPSATQADNLKNHMLEYRVSWTETDQIQMWRDFQWVGVYNLPDTGMTPGTLNP